MDGLYKRLSFAYLTRGVFSRSVTLNYIIAGTVVDRITLAINYAESIVVTPKGVVWRLGVENIVAECEIFVRDTELRKQRCG
jgi:hypothetical protein